MIFCLSREACGSHVVHCRIAWKNSSHAQINLKSIQVHNETEYVEVCLNTTKIDKRDCRFTIECRRHC
jgi:hypothetical protein